MRFHLALLLLVGTALGLSSTGGCVSKAEYDKALAACRNAQDALAGAQDALRGVRAENDKLKTDIMTLQNQLQAKDAEIGLLEQKNAQLQAAFERLNEMYNKLAAGPTPPDLPPLPEQVDRVLKQLVQQYPDLFEYDSQRGMLKLKSDFTFEKGSDTVKDEASQALAKFAQVMQMSEAANLNVYIAGHTDDIPIERAETRRRHPNNWYLSVHRAVAVEEAIEKAGVPPQRLAAMGFGEYHPVVANAPGKKGNAANRRVELWIVPRDRFLTTGQAAPDQPAEAPAVD